MAITTYLETLHRLRDLGEPKPTAPAERVGFVDAVWAGLDVCLDDGPMTGNAHRWRWLVVNGDHIGMRESIPALNRLAAKCATLNPAELSALKSAEMDREDRLRAREWSTLNRHRP